MPSDADVAMTKEVALRRITLDWCSTTISSLHEAAMPVSVLPLSYRSRRHWLSPAVAALVLGIGLAGCANDNQTSNDTIAWSQPGGSTVVPAGSTTGAATTPSGPPLDWRTNLSGDTVTVELRDANGYYRVERVDLVGPNGVTLTASEIDRETNRNSGDTGGYYGGGPSVGLGVGSWGGSGHSGTSVGLGLGFPLGGGGSYEPPPPVITFTRARIRLPDEAYYRQTAANWVVRISTTDRNNQPNTAVFPAPKPAG
jgi:hypothetical protein